MWKTRLLALTLMGLTLSLQAATDTEAMGGYEAISQSLADDDLANAKIAAAGLANKAGPSQPELAAAAEKLAQVATLPEARKEFKAVSAAAVALVAGKPGYYIMTCPMVSADWVQTSPKVHNPYMGKTMLDCGFPKN